MCGIAGYVTTQPAPESRAVLERMTDTIRHRGPDDSGYYQDALGFARLSPPEHHRPGGRPPADVERKRRSVDCLQRRDLQPRRTATGTGTERPPLRHAMRHGNCGACLRRVWTGLRKALSRHVCICRVGPREPAVVLRAGPARQEASVLLLGRPHVRIRFGDQGDTGASGRFTAA